MYIGMKIRPDFRRVIFVVIYKKKIVLNRLAQLMNFIFWYDKIVAILLSQQIFLSNHHGKSTKISELRSAFLFYNLRCMPFKSYAHWFCRCFPPEMTFLKIIFKRQKVIQVEVWYDKWPHNLWYDGNYSGASKGTQALQLPTHNFWQHRLWKIQLRDYMFLPQGICYSHWANGDQNGVISIGQWGVFNHEKGAIWQSHSAAQKEGVVNTTIFSNDKTY